jgi:chromosomal replication initiator protein
MLVTGSNLPLHGSPALQEVAMARDCTAARTLTLGANSPLVKTSDPGPTLAFLATHTDGGGAKPLAEDVPLDARRSAGHSRDPEAAATASRLHAALRERVGHQRYAVWFEGNCRFVVDADAVVVISPSRFAEDVIRRGFGGDIESVVADVCGDHRSLVFQLADSPVASNEAAAASMSPRATIKRSRAERQRKKQHPIQRPEEMLPSASAASADDVVADGGASSKDVRPAPPPPKRRTLATLEGFVTGPSNRMARAAAEMVVSRPGEISPLVIHGASGTGKTHLLEGIVSLLRQKQPGLGVLLVPAEQFTTGFLQALHGGGLPGFRRSYRSVDILLVDDLQFFSGKRATAVELQQTIDALLRQGRQVVCTSDREPAQLEELGADLLGRLEGGMSVRIAAADFDVRRGIVAGLAARRGLVCDDAVIDYVATHLTRNARELAGGVNRLEATAHMLGLPVSIELAQEALADLVRAGGRSIRLADIERAVCSAFGLEPGSLQSARRSRTVNHLRMLAMFLARKHTPAALTEIGSYFGRRSHSTVIAARKTVASWLAARQSVQLGDATWESEEAVRRVEEILRAG